jgi:hypothetical protein
MGCPSMFLAYDDRVIPCPCAGRGVPGLRVRESGRETVTDGQRRAREGNARHEGTEAAVDATGLTDVPEEVVAFIRYCYQRRRIGWPELYDEMCGVAARAEFRGIDYERLETLGVRFSLQEMGRLAALAHQVVADERRRRVAESPRATGAPLAFGVAGASR